MPARRTPAATWLGLAVALIGTPAINLGFRLFTPGGKAAPPPLAHELALAGLVAVLLWIVLRGERLPLTSIGLRFDRLGRSISWGLGLSVLVLFVRVAFILGPFGGGALTMLHDMRFSLPSASAILVSALGQGLGVGASAVSQELCYRGYPVERLETITGRRWIAGLLPLTVFVLSHSHPSPVGILQPLTVGALLTVFYVRRRDLIANLIANFLPVFLLNLILVSVVSSAAR